MSAIIMEDKVGLKRIIISDQKDAKQDSPKHLQKNQKSLFTRKSKRLSYHCAY